MQSIVVQNFKTPVGELLLGAYDGKLCLCDWKYRKMRDEIDKRIQTGLQAKYQEGHSQLIESAIGQLNEYFHGKRNVFDIPLLMVGSAFQQKVWNELLRVPYGKTISYLELSKKTGDVKAIRAVASANGANALSVVIPCHRIIGSNGKLVGYAGGLSAKQKLLRLEKADLFPQQPLLF
jgi:methylated-DNA-[protein]-cysteine S-methyltransferase